MIYTGVGSRETPPEALALIERVAEVLSERGFNLRSGGADGADMAFEKGARASGLAEPEIFLPWKEFNKENREPRETDINAKTLPNHGDAFGMAARICASWNYLREGGRACHTRNVYQVLGARLMEPSDLLVCWTKDGKVSGGTATAIKLAKEFNVPVFNLADEGSLMEPSGLDQLIEFLRLNGPEVDYVRGGAIRGN